MTPLLKAELIKLRTTRTFAALASAAVATSVLIATLVASLSRPSADEVLQDVFLADTSGLFILILAIVGITGEWRHRTITSSLLAAPDRLRFLAAKTIAFALAGVVLSLLIAVGVSIVGLSVLAARDLPTPAAGELIGQYGRNAGVAALLGGFGVALGSLVRNQVVGVVGILLVGLAIEPTLAALAPKVERFGPTGGLTTAIANSDPEASGFSEDELLAPGLAVLAMLAWIAALFSGGAALLRARDVD
jgi:ABC-2 type transport system permease protein